MPLGRQRLLQRFLSAPLYSDGARKTEEGGNATAKTAIAPHDKHRERRQTSASIDEHRQAPIERSNYSSAPPAVAGQNHRHLQKQLPINRGQANRSPANPSALSTWSVWPDKFVSPDRTAQQPKSNGSSAINPDRTVRQLASNSPSAQIDQFLIYALRTLTSIGARTAHAIKFIGKQTKRRKAHGERYHERHKQNRELHDRPLSANAKAPIVCSPREFRERIKPLSTSAGKVQFAGIIMPHERKTHAKRRSKMKFNF